MDTPCVAAPVRSGGRSEPALARVEAALASSRPACTIYAYSYSEHVLQIYAGLYALHQAGLIRVRQRFAAQDLQRRLSPALLDKPFASRSLNGVFVDVEDCGLVFFDVRDGANYYREIVDPVALYAKRSFRRSEYAPSAKKFVPLGLNYSVHLDRTTRHELARSLRQFDKSRLAAKRLAVSLVRLFPGIGRLLDVPTVSSLAAAPDREAPLQALFLARTWSPEEVGSAEAVQDLNDSRANCIRALRERLGERFFGGFARSPYALQRYADCVVDPQVSTERRHYLQRLKAYPVCVATTGLFESIGWKFAEYVALSKAIVSEPLRFELPGPIAAGENYLEFATPQECAARVAQLLEDADARLRMMARNRAYFAEHATPQAVVGRVLHAALGMRH